MKIPASSDISNCSCKTVTPTFKSSPSSWYFSTLLAIFSKATPRLRLSSIATHWPSSSLDESELCYGNGVIRVLSGHGGAFRHYSLILHIMPLVLPNSPAVQRSFPDSPTIFLCLPRSGPVSLLCQRAEIIAAFSRRVLQDVP